LAAHAENPGKPVKNGGFRGFFVPVASGTEHPHRRICLD
jgi:hypothetical protein